MVVFFPKNRKMGVFGLAQPSLPIKIQVSWIDRIAWVLTLLLSDNDCPKTNLNCPGRRPYGCLPGQRPTGGIELGRWAKLNFSPPDCL